MTANCWWYGQLGINDNNGGLEPIIAIYKSVVEFIKWYNQNTK